MRYLLALLLMASTVQARDQLLLAVKVSTWQDLNPAKKDKIKTFFKRFVTQGHGVTPQARYIHTATSNEIMVACFDYNKLQGRNGEDISAAKIATVKSQLNDAQIRLVRTSDPHGMLESWGLVAPAVDEP